MTETLEIIDRWDDGISWTLAGDKMVRTSHALVVEGEDGDPSVWIVDPVDAPGLDEELDELGDVAGVVLLLDRHKRDSAAVARRHEVPVYLPRALEDVADDLNCETEVFVGRLPGTDFRTITLTNNSLWQEVALYDKEAGTLVVAEAVGTAPFVTTPGERLGVHPGLRLLPPRAKLGGLRPKRIVVGHGPGVFDDAPMALHEALRGSRRKAPKLFARMLKRPFQ